ncbi:hypothetical protein [Actinomadura madurae]|uniref:hypothetical protein n=1 Tax=Actinomadura madurae TaxID=1993 RepID=UPI0020D250C1|nr:hypothetical protein [Actinomadura madurae]MCQ0013511.1 hypothetical protein [Actinomadura madurae]
MGACTFSPSSGTASPPGRVQQGRDVVPAFEQVTRRRRHGAQVGDQFVADEAWERRPVPAGEGAECERR